MTLQQIIETITFQFPNLGETEIKIKFNEKYKEFCAKSRIYTGSANLTLTSSASYSLPSDVGEVYRIDYKDSAGEFIEPNLQFIIEHNNIIFYNLDGLLATNLNLTGYQITLHYYKIPTALSSLSSSIAIETKYTEYIIAAMLQDYFATFPTLETPIGEGKIVKSRDWNAVRYYSTKYKEGLLTAIKEGNKQKDSTLITIQNNF